MHTREAGSGVQVPFGDIPSDTHTVLILPVGTNPVSHLKIMSVPPSVLGTFAMEPFPGAVGIPQLTKGKSNTTLIVNIILVECCSFHHNGVEGEAVVGLQRQGYE